MNGLKVIALAIAALAVTSAAATDYTAADYVTNGITMFLDGIENVGLGAAHDSSATT